MRQRDVVIVAGMHRSGTSAVARALSIFNRRLGDDLMPAAPNNNEKGFWEDLDVVALNDEILAACNRRWDSTLPLKQRDYDLLIEQGFLEQVKGLLEKKLSTYRNFAFKDPRLSKLLPLWKKAFEFLNINVSYVCVVRNPLSVAASLQQRDSFPISKSLFLWLEHILSFLNALSSTPALFVSYDKFMASPEAEIRRMAEWLKDEINPQELRHYLNHFLDEDLQHARYSSQDLADHEDVYPLVKEVYAFVEPLQDTLSASKELKPLLGKWTREFAGLEIFLRLTDEQSLCVDALDRDRAAIEVRLEDSQAESELRGARIAELERHLVEKDEALKLLEHQLHHLKLSRSWRITAPLRNLGAFARRFKAIVFLKRTVFLVFTGSGRKRLHQLAERKGGYLALTQATLSFVRQNGLRLGYKRAVLHIMGQASGLALMYEAHHDYNRWVEQYEKVDEEGLLRMSQQALRLAYKPVFSVVMPVYNPPIHFLCLAIESVIAQVYPHWELCIADDASTSPDVHACLVKYQHRDSRIKVIFRQANGHISAASNSALTLATGDYIALLDQDDLLPPYALFKVAQAINRNPDAQLLYSDEDKIDAAGNRFHPYFKSDWNPDLIYAHNMFSHLGVYKRDLVSKVGGFRIGLEGSQDYDLLLRCLEQVQGQSKAIVHLPYVLYHWRAHEGSTSVSNQAKPYAMIAGQRAINEHFQRMGYKGRVELNDTGYRPRYELPSPAPLVSILIPTRDRAALVEACVKSVLRKTQYPNFEILLIDNGSNEPESLRAWKRLEKLGVRVIRDEGQFNFSRLNNFAASEAKGELLCLLNNDTEVITPDWLNTMVSHALRPGVGAVGARLLFPDATVQHAGVILGLRGVAGHAHYTFPEWLPGYFGRALLTSTFSAVTGACLVVRRDLYQEMGGLDQEHLAVAFNDVDFCLKLSHKGHRCVYAADAVLIHHESVSRGEEDDPVKVARLKQESDVMYARWGHLIQNDPFYSPNLTLDAPDFGLAWPPRVESL